MSAPAEQMVDTRPQWQRDGFRIDPTIARKSGLDRIAKSPAHYLHYCREESPDTPTLRFGRAFHCYVLEPVAFGERYAVAPDFGDGRTKKAKEAKAAFLAENAGRELVPIDEFDAIRRMADSVMAHPTARNLVIGGQAEREIAWTDPRTGLKCGGRADFHIPELRIAVDLKTTDNADPAAFARSVATYRYHVQDAHYRAGFAAIGEPIEHFLFLAVEKTAPFAVSVCYVDQAALFRGEEVRDRDMDRLRACIETGEWPAYGNDLIPIAMPAWAFFD